MNISAGTRLGQYEIVDRLGSGGMGEVYRARDTRLGRDVAVKALSGELSLDPQRLSRFEAEARSASALNHPSIVTIHEIGQDAETPFIVMELVDGRTLRELLYAGAPPLRRTVALAAQLADALARAHEAGIIHRDLKPENVMVTRDGLPKILDFGLAKIEGRERENGPDRRDLTVTEETREGAVVGTSGYMSPEQASGQPSISGPTSSRSGRCSTRCSPASAPSTGPVGPRRSRRSFVTRPSRSRRSRREFRRRFAGSSSGASRSCPRSVTRRRAISRGISRACATTSRRSREIPRLSRRRPGAGARDRGCRRASRLRSRCSSHRRTFSAGPRGSAISRPSAG